MDHEFLNARCAIFRVGLIYPSLGRAAASEIERARRAVVARLDAWKTERGIFRVAISWRPTNSKEEIGAEIIFDWDEFDSPERLAARYAEIEKLARDAAIETGAFRIERKIEFYPDHGEVDAWGFKFRDGE